MKEYYMKGALVMGTFFAFFGIGLTLGSVVALILFALAAVYGLFILMPVIIPIIKEAGKLVFLFIRGCLSIPYTFVYTLVKGKAPSNVNIADK